MPSLEFYNDNGYPGQGISSELARGLLVRYDGVNLTQEGMGIGAAALISKGITCFSKSSNSRIKDNVITNTCDLDTEMIWRIRGFESRILTSFLTGLNDHCVLVSNRSMQKAFLKSGYHLKKLLGIKHRFVRSIPSGASEFRYFPDKDNIRVECSVRSGKHPLSKIYIMNELGADFFDASMINGKLSCPPSGWLPLENNYKSYILWSKFYQMGFSLISVTAPDDIPCKIFWGWEKNSERCWAGFDIELDCRGLNTKSVQMQYTLSFGTV